MKSQITISKKLVVINSASSLLIQVIGISALIWVQQYLLKRISLDEYSLLPIVYSLLVFLPFFSFILASGIKRYVTEAYAKNDLSRVTKIVSTMFPILLFGSGVLICLGLLLSYNIDKILKIDPQFVDQAQYMLMLLIGAEAFRLSMTAFNSGLYVKQKFVLENLVHLISESIRLALLFFLLFEVSVSILWVVVSTTVATVLQVGTSFILSLRLVPSQRFRIRMFDMSIFRELVNFGGWTTVIGLSGTLRKAADPFILNRFGTPLDVACFHLGSLIPNKLEIIINQSFLRSVSPAIVGLHASGENDKLRRLYLRLGRFALWGVLLITIPFFVHYDQIIILYVGEEFEIAGLVLVLLIACYPILYGNILIKQLANARLMVRGMAIRESVSTGFNLLLTLVLVGYYQLGALGSAIATFIAYGLGSIVLYWPFGTMMAGVRLAEVFSEILLPGLTPFFLTYLLMLMADQVFIIDQWLEILANSIFGGLVYLIAVWIMAKDIDRHQFKDALLNFIRYKKKLYNT